MINITVIGFGNVGSLLSTYLLNSSLVIKLNILEPSKEAEGALLDLQHSMALYPSKKLYINKDELFLQADYIFYTAGTPNKHGSPRLSTAKQNIQLAQEIFEHRSFENSPYIIVISNPVDMVSYALQHYAGLPAERVVGTGTFLDSMRFAYYLSSISNTQVEAFESWVLGEHGDSQVPVYSACKFQGKSLVADSFFNTEKLDKATELTKKAAHQIRKTQAGTKYGVVKCATAILEYLLGEEKKVLPLSMLTNEHYRNLLQLDHNIYISLPVKINNGKLEVDNTFAIEGKELNALRRSAKVLSDASHL